MKFVVVLIIAFLAPLLLMSVTIFAVDPLMVFHKPWYDRPVYYHDERYMMPGLIKSVAPDTIVVGPSTIQPFQADILKSSGIRNGLNVSLSASTLHEQLLTVNLGLKAGKLKRVVWGLEWVTIAWPSDKVTNRHGPFPHFLYDEPLRRLKDYLFDPDFLMLSENINTFGTSFIKDIIQHSVSQL